MCTVFAALAGGENHVVLRVRRELLATQPLKCLWFGMVWLVLKHKVRVRLCAISRCGKDLATDEFSIGGVKISLLLREQTGGKKGSPKRN